MSKFDHELVYDEHLGRYGLAASREKYTYEEALALTREDLKGRGYIRRNKMICKYKKNEVCTNADCEMAADYPAEEYCLKCKLFEPGSKEDEVEHLRYLFDMYVIADVRFLRSSYVDNDGKIVVNANDEEILQNAKKDLETAAFKFYEEYGDVNDGDSPAGDR